MRVRVLNGTMTSQAGQLSVNIPKGIPRDLAAAIKEQKDQLVAELEIKPRLVKAVAYLWNLEQQGQLDSPKYQKWFEPFLNLLYSYEHRMRGEA